MISIRITLPLAGLLLALLFAPRIAAAEPVDIVRQTTNTLFEIVDANRARFEENVELLRERIREVMLPRVDILYSGRLVLGRSGRSLSREQVEEFSDALSE
ncbi:MAG: ABC transporter substrate-binding protein, partial [Wenzhouxiangellaceae bacterium]